MSLLLSLVTPRKVTAWSPRLVQVIVTASPLVGGWSLLPAVCGLVTATRCLWTGHCALLVDWSLLPAACGLGHCALLLVDWLLLPAACGLVAAPCLWTGHCSPLLVDWSLLPIACGLVTAPHWLWTGHCSPLLVN